MLSEYDIKELKKANKILLKVLEYNYCDTKLRREVNRLDTIVIKLSQLIELQEK